MENSAAVVESKATVEKSRFDLEATRSYKGNRHSKREREGGWRIIIPSKKKKKKKKKKNKQPYGRLRTRLRRSRMS